MSISLVSKLLIGIIADMFSPGCRAIKFMMGFPLAVRVCNGSSKHFKEYTLPLEVKIKIVS
jgi:hypothetical protein